MGDRTGGNTGRLPFYDDPMAARDARGLDDLLELMTAQRAASRLERETREKPRLNKSKLETARLEAKRKGRIARWESNLVTLPRLVWSRIASTNTQTAANWHVPTPTRTNLKRCWYCASTSKRCRKRAAPNSSHDGCGMCQVNLESTAHAVRLARNTIWRPPTSCVIALCAPSRPLLETLHA